MMAKKAPNPVDRHVGSRVRMRRMMLGMSQEKLGNALGLTFQQVQKYEKGTNRIGASRLQQIAHILQVPVSFFFEGAPSVAGAGASRRHERGALARLRLRFSRYVGWAGADQGVHAHLRFQAAAPHRRSCRTDRLATSTDESSAARPHAPPSRPHFAHILTARSDAATTLSSDQRGSRRRSIQTSSDAIGRGLTRGVFRSATFKLSVHQRIRVGRTSGQGLRPNLRRHSRCISGKRRQARHCRRKQSQHQAGLRDAVHDQQDCHRRRGPRSVAAIPQAWRQSGR